MLRDDRLPMYGAPQRAGVYPYSMERVVAKQDISVVMASHSAVNPRQSADAGGSDDPVGRLKVSVGKIAVSVQKIGDVLGASKPGSFPTTVVHENRTKAPNDLTQIQIQSTNRFLLPSFQRKSAEEIRAQRANKAAEKKARAELAAAKKAAVVDKSGKHQEANKSKIFQEKLAPSQTNQSTSGLNHQTQNITATKSALRTDVKHQVAAEVQFDLSKNAVKSASEESVGMDVPPGPCSDTPAPPSTAHIHPAFLNLAVRCEQDIIDEVDPLCVDFIAAFREYLSDWSSRRQKENRDPSSIGHDLDVAIRPQIAYLTQDGRWPLPGPLGNIVRQLKKEIMKLGTAGQGGRVQTIEDINKWLTDCEEENFGSAYRAISEYLLGKMKTSPNVITYSWCPLVNKVLLDSVEKNFQAVFTVVDDEMAGRGLRHVRSFTERGIRCRYTDLNSVGAVMKTGSMVILGCSAVLSNGCIIAPKGSILVALAAKAFNIPVLVVSQTLKFVDKVQSYGRVALLKRESTEPVPPDLVTAIVTDIRVLPPSSAPAVLKAKALDLE
ncbi:hypothetical protein KIN20_001855 [Parelaphostrongylus tenuis]|uniref:Translation initiation factor eIF2B subunit delta n=1 Tax=Parelaphostrongylus tenuis TaxID=148309 RepID=A0AAD5MDD6_PARTN|nr:hypothetical protein KIN20_001855 [Parelaphostrongylus tenuis]